MRLIDADSILTEDIIRCFLWRIEADKVHALENLISNCETIDPVLHGQWIEKHPQLFTCSECGVEKFDPSDYCPHCGAKMTR